MLRSISLARTSPLHLLSPPYSSSSDHQNRVNDNDGSYIAIPLFNRDPMERPRLFLVQPRLKPPTFLQAKLNEALCLANSLEEQRDGYFDTDFFEKEYSFKTQLLNPPKLVQRACGKPMLDCVGLIIEIFNAHAHSKEAKLQAELAALMYKTSRLARVRGPDGRSTFGVTTN